jgi:hypothetical protein
VSGTTLIICLSKVFTLDYVLQLNNMNLVNIMQKNTKRIEAELTRLDMEVREN